MSKKISFLFVILLISFQSALAQVKTITGTVTDEKGSPLPGVSVLVEGTTKGVATDFDGNYSIETEQGKTLVFSYIGFTTQRILVKGGGKSLKINVLLKEDAQVLDEVVVTGYATQSRNTLATSISKLDNKTLESAPRSNVATALQGSIAGLKVTQNTGQPGSTPSIQLRGGTNFNGSGSPLILVDGVPGSFYALNGDDVESIEVLKDAASTAIYGARAANGVILVTTKKGKNGKSSITFRTKYTANYRRSPGFEYMNAAEYVKFNRLAIQAYRDQIKPAFGQFLNGVYPAGTGNNATNSTYTTMVLSPANEYLLKYEGWMTMDDPINPGQKLIFQDNDMASLFYQPSDAKDYSLSFTGGNDKGTYYLGLGYLDDKGLVIGTGFERLSGTFNGSYKIKENFKVSSNIMYAQSQRDPAYLMNLYKHVRNPEDAVNYTIFQRAGGMAPTARIYYNNPDGSLTSDPHPGVDYSFGNPLYYRDKFIAKNLEQRINGSVQFDWKFLDKFNLMVRGGHFTLHNNNEYFNKKYITGGRVIDSRNASAKYNRTMRNQITSVLSYGNSFGKHSVDALLGTEYFIEKNYGLSGATKGSPTDLIETMNAGAEADGVPSSSRNGYAIASLFGQLNYDYDNRYLLGLTFRRDGTSRLAEGNKYDFFPGISLGWNIHNEQFFKDSSINSIITKVKPRISYGVNGNIDVLSNYGVFGLYQQTPVYNGQIGYVNTSLPNLGLKWERSTTLNFGLDLSLFNNRITLIADYFIRDVEDKLSNLTLPLWTGFSSITTNNGILRNKGLELELNARVINHQDFKWNVGTTFFTVKNYAHKLPDNGVEKNRQGGTQIYDPSSGELIYVGGLQQGERVGNDIITSYVFDGVYKTQADIDAHAGRDVTFAKERTKRFLGDAKWKDLNGDNIIDYKDRVIIGRTRPDVMGGISTNLSYKGLSLYVKTDYALGHYAVNGMKVKGMAQTQGAQNGPKDITQSWTPENPDSNIPRYVFVDPQRNFRAAGDHQGDQWNGNSFFWEKADYLALREVTLSYDLPERLMPAKWFKELRMYVTGANLAYFTEYSGNSPENGGVDTGTFPLPKTFTMGLNVKF